MARLAVGMVFGVVIGVLGGAACGIRADDLTSSDIAEAAPEAEEAQPEVVIAPPARDWVDRILDCLARYESQNSPSAYNRSSGASGLLQFLPSTWRSTPQGRAGLSIWDASAQRAAGRYMILAGRGREWTTWRLCA